MWFPTILQLLGRIAGDFISRWFDVDPAAWRRRKEASAPVTDAELDDKLDDLAGRK